MAFLSVDQLEQMGFKSLGKDVLISDKASIYNPEQMMVGDYSRIDDFCVVSGRVAIGRNVHIAVFCNVAGGSEGVVFSPSYFRARKKELLNLEQTYLSAEQRSRD